MAMDMEPAIWGTLPEQLLHLVFSRLSAAEICQLRLLSKGWKRDIDSSDSEMSMVLGKTIYPSMFGLIAWKDHGEPVGFVFDLNTALYSSRSRYPNGYTIEIDAAEDYLITMGAADGGLVCFVSESKKKPMFLVVMNPLTRKKIELPPLLSMDGTVPNVRPTMVQLTMDRQTQQYKVIFVGSLENRRFAQVYDSKMKGWTVVGSEEQSWDRIFGFEYCWSDEDPENYTAQRLGPCVYDFAAGGLQHFGSSSIQPPGESIAHAFWKNRVFVLCVDKSPVWPISYFIEEYVLEKNSTAWVKVGTIGENFLTPHLYTHGADDRHHFTFHACNGYLVLFGGWDGLAYFYCISKPWESWQDLPCPGSDDDDDHDKFFIVHDHSLLDLMCELRWNATP